MEWPSRALHTTLTTALFFVVFIPCPSLTFISSDPHCLSLGSLRMRVSDPVDVPVHQTDQSDSTSSLPNESFVHYSPSYSSNSFTLPVAEEIPFDLVPGEVFEETDKFENCTVYLTNFRLVLIGVFDKPQSGVKIESFALVSIDSIDTCGVEHLVFMCKDARAVKVGTQSAEKAMTWYKRLTTLIVNRSVDNLFTWNIASRARTGQIAWLHMDSHPEWDFDEYAEFRRLQIDPVYMKVADFNENFKVCSSYPKHLVVPKNLSREELDSVCDYRMLARFPAVTWFNSEKHNFLLRASQPRSSFFSWRNSADELLLRLYNEYTAMKRNVSSVNMKIQDARSYAAAWGNRAKGGGFEVWECYSNCSIEFLGLPNIHAIRYSLCQLRNLFLPPIDQGAFLKNLQATGWLYNIQLLLQVSNKTADLLRNGDNVLVHCSDGWDRTTQIVSLTKLLIDPYFRTKRGFEELIRKDWIGFGHKFSDRNGVTGKDVYEKSPIFFQWLDAVHQIHTLNSTAFEFNMAYLVRLALHHTADMFSSFCFNTVQEMQSACTTQDRSPLPIWNMLNSDLVYENALYEKLEQELRAPETVQSLRVWHEVFRCEEVESLMKQGNNDGKGLSSQINDKEPSTEKTIVKSKSTESITSACESMSLYTHSSYVNRKNSESVDNDTPDSKESRRSGNSLSKNDKDSRTSLHVDGLYLFTDRTQEIARKKIEKHAMDMERKRARIASERSDISSRGEEAFQMDCDFYGGETSDMSIVDESEVHNQPGRNLGYSVHSSCQMCRASFGLTRKRHCCGSCGRAVCDACSLNRYKETVDGTAKDRRACSGCFEKMKLNESEPEGIVGSLDSLHSSPSLSTPPLQSSLPPSSSRPSHSPSSCPEEQRRVGSFRGTSQAVKG